MKLHEIFADPFLMDEVRRRSCSGMESHIGPPVKLRPVAERWSSKQSQNPTPGIQERENKAPLKGETGPR